MKFCENGWTALTIGLLVGSMLVAIICSCGNVPRLINLTVETKPAADIYFDSFYIGTGSADLQVFSNTIPNYLEMRDIITGDVLTRLLVYDISTLQRIFLEYNDEDWRSKRIHYLLEYMHREGMISSDSLNGQVLDQESGDLEARQSE